MKDKFFIRNDWNESSVQAKRRVLSYQFSCVVYDEAQSHFCHYDYIVLCESDTPLSYARLINGFLSLLKVEMPQFKKHLRQYKSFENPNNLSISSKAYTKAKDKHERSYPYNKIVLVSHFNGVDLTNFYNNKKMMDQLSCMNKLSFFNGRAFNSDNYHDKLRGIRTATLIRDTMLLSSNNSSLQSLGENIGIEKLDCSDYVDRMDKLLQDDISRYVECGLSDSVISLIWTLTFNENNLNQKDIYSTVGSAAAHRIRESIKAKNRWTTDKEFNENYLSIFDVGNYYQGRNQQISDKRSLIEQDAISSFFGGRNECFSHGIFTAESGKEFLDIDLRSAYPIAMCICSNMNWNNPIDCSYNRDNTDNGKLRSEMFKFDDLGFGLVDFEFPKELAYPCIPVKSTTFNGLVFPRKGSTYANISEIKLALDMGASVTVSEGGRVVVLSTKDENDMFDAVKEFIKTRKLYEKKYGKKSGQALLQKLYANSAFGKLGQGINGKRYQNLCNNTTEMAQYSVITMPAYAAAITALVRCLVSFCMHCCEKADLKIHSVTTDGFIVAGERESVLRMLNESVKEKFPFIFEALEQAFSNSDTAFEVKHEFKTFFNSRTRANVSVGEGEGIMAKGSYRGNDVFRNLSEDAKHHFFFEALVTRTGKIRDERVSLPSYKDVVKHNKVFMNEMKVANLSFDFDFKRMIDMPTIQTNQTVLNGKLFSYDSFFTLPLETVEEYESLHKYRDSYAGCVNNRSEYANIHQKYRHLSTGTETRYNPKMNSQNEQHLDYVCKELLKMVRQGMLTDKLASLNSKDLYDLFMTNCEWDISYEAFNNAFKKGKGRKVMLDGETPLFSVIKQSLLGAS
ncbi:hypothetical protein SAMN05216375_12345 [Trichococcus ilyis]|uniref:DNA-directed DNA polymerase n=1 Tax=Trichococcus ilyis TaxID=640938 RepID=A0A143YYA1_9LACT|nr:Hypothetical protein TR210_1665 [Trichococcus ilyis]SEJ72352.1 hypothetical protein SAMN05216375_12345 [Trichococcus ilyis]